MVRGIDVFRKHFKGFENQYVLIGGAACDILFARNDCSLKTMRGLTKIHIDDEVSSLSAILLNDEYYRVLLAGREVVQDLCVLRPEYLILFKAKAYLDLSERKLNGENVDSRDIKKHKNDILRILAEFVLEEVEDFPETVKSDVDTFIKRLETEPFDENLLKSVGLSNEEMMDRLVELYGVK